MTRLTIEQTEKLIEYFEHCLEIKKYINPTLARVDIENILNNESLNHYDD